MDSTDKRDRPLGCFSALPKEIRDYIWQLAFEPFDGSPEIHFFSLVGEPVDHYLMSGDLDTGAPRWAKSQTLLKPHPLGRMGTGKAIWPSKTNISGYMNVNNLRNVCVEAREAFTCRSNKNWYDAQRSGLVNSIRTEGPTTLYITIRPEIDVICIEVPKAIAACRDISCANLGTGLPVRNIAFTYDPQWHDEIAALLPQLRSWEDRKLIQDGLTPACRFLDLVTRLRCDPGLVGKHDINSYDRTKDEGMTRLWLIDPSLKPSEDFDIERASKNHTVFNACGRKYIGVGDFDTDGLWEISENHSRDRTANSIMFLLWQFWTFWGYHVDPFDCLVCTLNTHPPGEGSCNHGLIFGVLAFVDVE